jgi:antitoxin MazE
MIYILRNCISGIAMKVAKWGNSLAIRLPAVVVEALNLKVGDDVEVLAPGQRSLRVESRKSRRELIERLRKYEGRMPPDFKFDRLEANERG